MKQFKLIFGLTISMLIFFSCSTPKYSSIHNHWVRIKYERKDGSRNYTRGIQKTFLSDIIILPYCLLDKSSTNFPCEFYFKLKGDSTFKLLIDNLSVQSVNDINLVLLMNDNGGSEDKIEKYVYSSIIHYPKYLKDNHLIDKENDSTIILNKYFSPFYIGYWYHKLEENFKKYNSLNGLLKFSMLLDSTGKTCKIDLYENDNIDKKVADDVAKLLADEQSWDLSYIKGHLNYKLSISIKFVPKETFQYIDLIMFDDENNKKYQIQPIRSLRFEEQDTLKHYFSEGLKQISGSRFNDAIYSYSRCITADSLCFEAYYNRAFANFQLQQIDESCIDWECLFKQFGQKPAEKMYNENCISNKANAISKPTSGVKQ